MERLAQKSIFAFTLVTFAVAHDLKYSGLDTVTDNSRYTVLHPETKLKTFDKIFYRGGLSLFSLGKRISGDRLMLNFYDSTEHTTIADLEARLSFSDEHKWENVITRVEIYAAVSSKYANVHFIDGGIRKAFCQILFTFDKTYYAEFEIFVYGY